MAFALGGGGGLGMFVRNANKLLEDFGWNMLGNRRQVPYLIAQILPEQHPRIYRNLCGRFRQP